MSKDPKYPRSRRHAIPEELGVEPPARTNTIIHDWNDVPRDGVYNDNDRAIELVVSSSVRKKSEAILTKVK